MKFLTESEIKTLGLLDHKNESLYKEVSSLQDIKVILVEGDDYGVFSKGNENVIYVPMGDLNSASFAHELLHVYLQTKGIFIAGGLVNAFSTRPLNRLATKDLPHHIGNCLEHIKMFPLFLDMGYDRSLFIQDYADNKFSSPELSVIKANFYSVDRMEVVYNKLAVDLFMAKYFAGTCVP